MNSKQIVFPYRMEQILKEKGFVFTSQNGFTWYSIPGVPFSFKTHIQFNHPIPINIFNQRVESALEYSNQYLKQFITNS